MTPLESAWSIALATQVAHDPLDPAFVGLAP